LPDQFVLNFIHLITSKPYQTSFFAKELGIFQDGVDLISILMKLKSPSLTEEEKNNQLTMIGNATSSIGQLLSGMGVDGSELCALIQLVFQTYNQENVTHII
jgi:hypothetical protein